MFGKSDLFTEHLRSAFGLDAACPNYLHHKGVAKRSVRGGGAG